MAVMKMIPVEKKKKNKKGTRKSPSLQTKWRRQVCAVKTKPKPKPLSFGSGKKWLRGEKIGQGGFGSVFVAFPLPLYVDLLRMPTSMAIKSAEMSHASSIRDELRVYNEIDGHSCRCIIEHYGEEVTESSEGFDVYNLALEIADGGSLDKYMEGFAGEGLPEWEVRGYAGEILEGIRHIHKGGYVHCDLKPENVLLVEGVTEDGRRVYTAKVADLGLAKKEDENERGWRGTPTYLAPETIEEWRQDKASDIWALGLMVLEMLTGVRSRHVSYNKETGFYVDDVTIRPRIPDSISSLAREFIGLCLQEVPEFRMSAKMLSDHKFVREVIRYGSYSI